MKLSEQEINILSLKVARELEKKVDFKKKKDSISQKIEEVFLLNKKEEDEITNEAEAMLKQHGQAVAGSDVNYKKMFEMVKKEIAKKKNFVIEDEDRVYHLSHLVADVLERILGEPLNNKKIVLQTIRGTINNYLNQSNF